MEGWKPQRKDLELVVEAGWEDWVKVDVEEDWVKEGALLRRPPLNLSLFR